MRTYNLSGGLRLDRPESELEDGELPEITNYIYGEEERPEKRKGLSRVIATPQGASPVDGLYRTSVGGTNPHTLVAIGGTVYRVLDSNPTWEPLVSGLVSGNPYRFDTFMDKVYFVNGADGLQSWDGTTVSTVVGPPAGSRFVQYFSDRLFVGSSFTGPDRIAYSDLLDPTVWEDLETMIDNLIDISPGDDQRITGMIRTRDQLTFFKSRSTLLLWGYDPDEWQLERISDSIGCIAPGSVKEIDSHTYWLSHRGVYLDDGRNFRRIGARIQPYVETLTQSQQSKAVAVVSGWNYILIFPDTPEGCVGFAYNVRMDNWAKLEFGVPLGSLTEKNLDTDVGGWMAGSAEQSLIYHGETGGTDDGDDIDAVLRLPKIGITTPEIQYYVRKMALDARVDVNDTMTLEWQIGSNPVNVKTFTGDGPQLFSGKMEAGNPISVTVRATGSGTSSIVRGMAGQVLERRRLWR